MGRNALKHGFLADSHDNGYTWTNLRLAPVTPEIKRGYCPSELVQLPDGRVVWIYFLKALEQFKRSGELDSAATDKAKRNFGVLARVSTDEGQTWSAERYRLRLFRHGGSGYPASTVLKDGTILTVTGGNRGDRPLAIRWRMPKNSRGATRDGS